MGKTIVLMVALSLVTALAAWGSGQNSTEKATLSWYVYGWNQQEVDVYKAQAAAFMKAFPNITIETVPVPDGWSAKINSMIAAGTPPDVWFGSPQDNNASKIFLQLDDYIKRDKIDWNIYTYPDLMKKGTYFYLDNHQYGLPSQSPTFGTMAYSVKLMKDNGLQEPSEKYPRQLTTDEFVDYATKIKKSDAAGNTTIYGSDYLYYGWMVSWFDVNLDSWDPNWTSPEVIEMFNFIYDGHFVKKYALDLLNENHVQWFVQNKCGMLTDHGAYLWPEFMKVSGFDWDICSMPVKKLPRKFEVGPSNTQGISKITKYPEAAWQFIKWQSTSKEFMQIGSALGWVGATKANQKWFVESTKIPKHIGYHVTALGPTTEPAAGDPNKVVTWDGWGPLWQEKDAFYSGQISVKDFCTKMQGIWVQLAKEGKEKAAGK